jgi:CDP-diacylglycerol---serine O-phosphatidyltransferase
MSESRVKRVFRYLAPNLITAASICFGMLSLVAAYEGRHVDAGWLIIYAVLTDRLDGFVARLVRGTSELGVQLDSLADFLSFGICPAFLMFTALSAEPGLPFADGLGQILLMIACASWIFGATFRLARYNITTDVPGHPKIFFGVPTTLAAGTLIVWYLALAKYAAPGDPMAPPTSFGGLRLLGDLTTPPEIWRWVPVILFVGGLVMASNLRMPKLGLMRSRAATIFVFANVFAGYAFGFIRVFPEYLVLPPTLWLVVFLVWGQLSREARRLRPPPIFPAVDPPPGAEPIRPEDDLLPDDVVLGDDDDGGHSSGVKSSSTPTG